VISPYTEEVIGRVPEATPTDMDAAVAAALDALEHGPWPRTHVSERVAMIAALSREIAARSQEIADLITAEMGSPASWSVIGQAFAATLVLDAFAEHAQRFPFEERRAGMMGASLVRRAPVGVAACLIPWNVPLFLTCMKLGAAMAAGVPVVLKPAPETPLDAYILAEMVEKIGLPPGVLNIVPAGREVGEHLVRHHQPDHNPRTAIALRRNRRCRGDVRSRNEGRRSCRPDGANWPGRIVQPAGARERLHRPRCEGGCACPPGWRNVQRV
jgi:betaine-aldehyde dehydrogenase